MIRASKVVPAAERTVSAKDSSADIIELDFDQRHRRRIVMTTNAGLDFLLDLPKAIAIADGDGIELDDGRVVTVRAREEPVAEIAAKDPNHLARIAWHLGNRHLPTEILGDRLRIRNDHVIVEMVKKLGASVEIVNAPFHPEGGAYGRGHEH